MSFFTCYIELTGRFNDEHGCSIGEKTFTTNVEFDRDFNILTDLPSIANHFFEKGTYIYYSMTNIVNTYTTVYYYTDDGDDLLPDWDYPGLQNVSNQKIKDSLSDSQYNDTIQKHEDLGNEGTVKFLNGEIDGPYNSSDGIYRDNPIVWVTVEDSEGCYPHGQDLHGEHPDNLHMMDSITFIGKVSYANTDGNYDTIIRCFQHLVPSHVESDVSKYMKTFYDDRMEYYKNKEIDKYNQIKGT